MALDTSSKITIPTLLLIPLLGGVSADNLFVYRDEFDAVKLELDELKTSVDLGHDLAEAQSKLYTATRFWADLYGREMMYKGQYEAGILNDSQIDRYRDVQRQASAAAAEMERYDRDVEDLQ